MTLNRGYQASLQLFTRMYANVPYFSEIFDEDTFYIFAFAFILGSFFLAFVLSRFVRVKECDW